MSTLIYAVLFSIIAILLIRLRKKQQEVADLQGQLNKQYDIIKERLALSNKFSKMLADVATQTFEAVIITDKDGAIEWVNDGFTKITGYEFAEVKGKKPGKILQGPETDPFTVERIRESLKKKVIFKEEILNYHKTGRKYWLSISVTPILDHKGEIEKFIAIESDITDEKKQRLELQEKLQTLQPKK